MINLDGVDGASHQQQQQQEKGVAGKPGNTGMNAGNFLGFTSEVINGELMIVTLNGGRGGTGQDGTSNDDVAVQFESVSYKDDNGGMWDSIDPPEHVRVAYLLARYDYEDIGGDVYRLHSRCCGTTGLGGAGL